MILLDTDHATILQFPQSERATRIRTRMAAGTEIVAVSIVTIEERMRGWLAAVAKEREPGRQVTAYRELAALFTWFARQVIIPFDMAAVERFNAISSVQIDMMDRKIAAVALANNALLLTSNARHFSKIPGLKFADWTL